MKIFDEVFKIDVKKEIESILKGIKEYSASKTMDLPFLINDTGTFPPIVCKKKGEYYMMGEPTLVDLPCVRPCKNPVVIQGEQLIASALEYEDLSQEEDESLAPTILLFPSEVVEKIRVLRFIVAFTLVLQMYWSLCDLSSIMLLLCQREKTGSWDVDQEKGECSQVALKERNFTKRERELLLVIGNVELNPGPKYRFIDKFSWKDRKKSSVDGYLTIHSLTSFSRYVKASLQDEVITRVDYSVTVKSNEKFPIVAIAIDKPPDKEIVDLSTAMVHSSGSTPYFIDSGASVFIQHTFKYPKSLHLYVFSFHDQDKLSSGYMAIECYDVYTRAGTYSAPPRFKSQGQQNQGGGKPQRQGKKKKGKKKDEGQQQKQAQQEGQVKGANPRRRKRNRKPKQVEVAGAPNDVVPS